MKLKKICNRERENLRMSEVNALYLYHNMPSKSTLDNIAIAINNNKVLCSSGLTLHCIQIPSKRFAFSQKGKRFELCIDGWSVGDCMLDAEYSGMQHLLDWLIDKLLIFKELKAMSEDVEPLSSGIGRVARSRVNTLFEIFNNYFYVSGREVNEENKKEFIEIVKTIYKC